MLRVLRLVALALFAAGVYLGWSTFLFLTDDAFIAFRYASNELLGFGLVWNPPPFAPVEGYTSLLWVTLLDLVWRVLGVAPPQAANWIALGFGYATLALLLRAAMRATWPVPLRDWRDAIVAIAFLGIVTNRSFLTWLSSGLETSLFNFATTWWLCSALVPGRNRTRQLFALCTSATLAALTRPDGLLFAAASLVAVAAALPEKEPERRSRLLCATPLLAIPLHFVWRRATYDAWLPNTFTAKAGAFSPASGVDYFFSFALENGLLVWLGVCTAVAVAALRRRDCPPLAKERRLQVAAAIAALGLHFAFYTLWIGGDHFEYRVYSHLIPLCFLSLPWLAAKLRPRPGFVLGTLVTMVLLSWPIPWVHWWETRGLTTRADTYQLREAIAGHFPPGIRSVVAAWDASQARLISQYVGVRHQEHKVFAELQQRWLPTRAVGERIGWEERAILAIGSVGVPGWVLPEVAIIDVFGLNDRVIARNLRATSERRMAHDRRPPEGYVECFRPNLRIDARQAIVTPRVPQLRDSDIRDCETRDWALPK